MRVSGSRGMPRPRRCSSAPETIAGQIATREACNQLVSADSAVNQ
jgi:hypothetical protein